MNIKKTMIAIITATGLLFGLVSMVGACKVATEPEEGGWQYSIDTYDYYGSPALTGTVPGAIYTAKVAVITNTSSTTETLLVDLYYSSSFEGKYQYSPDEGEHWIWILDGTGNPVDTWEKSVQAGAKIWLRCWILNNDGNPHHILSPSPWGEAKSGSPYYEEYYFAFPPGAHYYGKGWKRDIVGFVAVILE